MKKMKPSFQCDSLDDVNPVVTFACLSSLRPKDVGANTTDLSWLTPERICSDVPIPHQHNGRGGSCLVLSYVGPKVGSGIPQLTSQLPTAPFVKLGHSGLLKTFSACELVPAGSLINFLTASFSTVLMGIMSLA